MKLRVTLPHYVVSANHGSVMARQIVQMATMNAIAVSDRNCCMKRFILLVFYLKPTGIVFHFIGMFHFILVIMISPRNRNEML
jgi:hypothetical protein